MAPSEEMIEFREALLRGLWTLYRRTFRNDCSKVLNGVPPADSKEYGQLLQVATTLMRIRDKSDEDWTADRLVNAAIEGAEFFRKRFDGRMPLSRFTGNDFLGWLHQQFIPDDAARATDFDCFGRDVAAVECSPREYVPHPASKRAAGRANKDE